MLSYIRFNLIASYQGKAVLLMGLLAHIVGNFQYLGNCISINFDENELCPGVVSILVSTELST